MEDVRKPGGLQGLFAPLTIRSFTSKNRFAMAPMAQGVFDNGAPTPAVVAHYEARALGGVGLIITGGVIIDHPLGSGETNIGRMNRGTVEAWKRLAGSVHEAGAGIFCQLWHQGPQTRPGMGPHEVTENGTVTVKAATRQDLRDVVDAYARSAELARNAGFDGVEIHGAHGYLPDSYLREYGASAPVSAEVTEPAFVYHVVAAVRQAVGADFPICFRFSRWSVSPYTGDYLSSPAAMEKVLLPLREAGVDVFHASRGFDPFWPPEFPDSPLSLAGWARRLTGMPVIAVGHLGLNADESAERPGESLRALTAQFAAGQFDMIAVGRALLRDPEWCGRLAGVSS